MMQRLGFGKRNKEKENSHLSKSQNKSDISTTSEKESSATPIQTAQQTILATIEAAVRSFEQELSKTSKAIKDKLQILETEFVMIQTKIKIAQQEEDEFDANHFSAEIFRLKEIKCDRDLNTLYNLLQVACDEVGRLSKWGLPLEQSQQWSIKKNSMEKQLLIQCKKPIKEFSKIVAEYAQNIGIKNGYSNQLEPSENTEVEQLIPDPLITPRI